MPQLLIIIASVRQGRNGTPVSQWFIEYARRHGGFEVEVADLAELDLPLLNEPHHPRLRRYTQDTTFRWSAIVDAADAVVVVTPEYNHSYPAALKNAFDTICQEWACKPIAFVSYGMVSGGTRATAAFKQVASALQMAPILQAVNIPFVPEKIVDGTLPNSEVLDTAAQVMLDELLRWTEALMPLRTKV